jgi:hypothetical protein
MPFCQNKEIKKCADFGYKDCTYNDIVGCSMTDDVCNNKKEENWQAVV